MVLVYHMILQDRVMKWSCGLMGSTFAFKAAIGEKFVNSFCQCVQKQRRERKEKLEWQLQSFLGYT